MESHKEPVLKGRMHMIPVYHGETFKVLTRGGLTSMTEAFFDCTQVALSQLV